MFAPLCHEGMQHRTPSCSLQRKDTRKEQEASCLGRPYSSPEKATPFPSANSHGRPLSLQLSKVLSNALPFSAPVFNFLYPQSLLKHRQNKFVTLGLECRCTTVVLSSCGALIFRYNGAAAQGAAPNKLEASHIASFTIDIFVSFFFSV